MTATNVEPMLEPNIEEMQAHLEHLFGGDLHGYHDGLIEIARQANVPNASGRFPVNHAELFPVEELDAAVRRAVAWNRAGHNVYVGAALRKPDTPRVGRCDDEDVYAQTSYFVDIDDPAAARRARGRYENAPPTVAVVTGRYPDLRAQLWWRLEEPNADPASIERHLRGLAAAFGGDMKTTNPGRVMRIGGSIAWPVKNGRMLERTEVQRPKKAPSFYVETILEEAYPPLAEAPQAHGTAHQSATVSETAEGPLGLPTEKIVDGRETYMRDTVLACFVEFIGENGTAPTPDELFEIAWPQYSRKVDFSRAGRGPDEMMEKCEYIVRRFGEGRLPGLRTLESVVEAYRQKQERKEQERATAPRKAYDGPLPLVWFKDIEANTETSDFVEGLLCDGQMSVVYGESNCGKTFFISDLGLHVAWGKSWRGREVERGGVIYVALEGGYGIKNRIAAFKAHYGLEDTELPFAVVPCSINLLNPDADTDRLIALIQSAAEEIGIPVRLIVIDTLSRALAGGNENAPDDMGALVINADRIRQQTSAHLCFIHHSGKDTAKGARGHSLLRAATDTEIEVSRDTDAKISVAKATKQRELDIDGEFAFELHVIELGKNKRGKPVTSCIVKATEGILGRRQKLTPNQRQALDILRNCIIDRGRILENRQDIPRQLVVRLDEWRDFLARACVTSRDNQETARKQFVRFQQDLVNKGVIGVWDGYVWIPGQRGTARDNG